MAFFPVLVFLLPILDLGFAQDKEPKVPWGCGFGLTRPYTLLCDLEAVWGVVVEGFAAAGILTALLLALVLLCRLRSVTEAEKRSGVGPILLLLLGIVGLFGLSFAYLIERNQSLCVVHRALWGVLFSLCFSCMLVQGVRLRRLGRERRSPCGCALTGLALGLAAVQGIVAAEWLLLTVLRHGQQACQYEPLDFALACSYVLVLLIAALVAAVLAVCSKAQPWRCNAVWLLVSCLLSVLLWATWIGFYVYGNKALEKAPEWDDPVLAVALVAQGWLLLLCHAAPEAHVCLRPPAQPSAPDYFDTSQNSTRMRETSFDEDIPLSHRQFVENQGYGFDENTAGLRSGGQHNGNTGTRPSAPFRSNVYQPTEMTMILNGGAVPSAPPTYTGRQLW
ncbi:G protein-coupled receptor, class C, group 5, member Ba [Electrophorus electricus]|uniref:G protein-coupled receptor, class C, group 5, member Ba n=1 Tax=Electrophorus electricus TaxID=8005 RepID=UPI000F0A1C0C|nr:G protein-coupled receptor, class C, group 5, member Ba [Electrophorus electricus]XP_026862389.1 G protein-coupled receptor, class C, group 5, member Ba [Electrophorus electricus]XP_026862390.1 G protein-coupled receptor, class C, group 5, member Ba [Electrophorus electricus]